MCQYLVQINLPQNPPRYIDLHKLLVCFRCDPNLSSLPQDDLGSIMLQLYIVTGCDFVSYFSGIGKATFLKCFYQHADFIAGAHQTGSLSHTLAGNLSSGFLSLVRLTGTVYFKSNLASLVSKLGFETPNQLYNSMDPNLNEEEKHREWYLSIKRVIRIVHEDQQPPTLTALWRHWMRSCWIKQMWGNSNKPDHYVGLPCPESHGWHESNEGYSIDWEADDVVQQIQATLNFIDKVCTCKTGCKTKWCSCQKNERSCGAGCECRGCTNIPTSISTTLTTVHEDEEGEDQDQEDEAQEEEDEDPEEEEDDQEPCEKDTDEEDTDERTLLRRHYRLKLLQT